MLGTGMDIQLQPSTGFIVCMDHCVGNVGWTKWTKWVSSYGCNGISCNILSFDEGYFHRIFRTGWVKYRAMANGFCKNFLSANRPRVRRSRRWKNTWILRWGRLSLGGACYQQMSENQITQQGWSFQVPTTLIMMIAGTGRKNWRCNPAERAGYRQD